MFDKAFAEKYIDDQLRFYNIRVVAWSVGSCGRAWWKKRAVKIPKPTNIDRFGVCLHEIKHIIDGNKGKRYEQEFACDMYAMDKLKELDWETYAWEKRMRWHVLSRIAMAFNRKLKLETIKPEIKDFFKEIDFSKWEGKKVFVYSDDKSVFGYKITYSINLNGYEVSALLKKKGLEMEKSEADDSTYGNWTVSGEGQNGIFEFENLSQIINHYQLNN